MNAKTTYYIKLKSCTNIACETQVLESQPLPGFEIVAKARNIARTWGLGNGSNAVEVTVETFSTGCIVPQHVVDIFRPVAPTLTASLNLDSEVKFHAVLEALQQYIDNGRDAEDLIDDDRIDEFQAKLEAAEAFRDQLDAVLASLANA